MDQGVLEAVRYKRSVLKKLLIEEQEGKSMIEFLKSISIKDVVYMSAAAWEDISSHTLAKSWHMLLGGSSEDGTEDRTGPYEAESSEPTCEELIHQVDSNLLDEDVQQWLGEVVNNPRYQLMSEEEILKQVRNEVAPAEDDESDEEPDEPNIPSNGEAAEMFDKCVRWFEHQEESTPSSMLLLKRIRDLAIKKRYSQLRQLRLDSFSDNLNVLYYCTYIQLDTHNNIQNVIIEIHVQCIIVLGFTYPK